MAIVKRAAIIASAAVAAGLGLAAPAGADPGFDPCHSSVLMLCRMLPVMPDLDHDIDLSQDPNALTDGQGAAADQPGLSQPGAAQPGTSQPIPHLPGANQPGASQPGASQPDTDLNGG
jgi:hypothetical protein